MNPETEKNVNEAIDWLQKTGGAIQDFAVEQAPLYCREVVAWEFWLGIALIFGGILTLFAGYLALRSANKLRDDEVERYQCSVTISDFGPRLISYAAWIGAAILIASGGHSSIKAAVAPRLVIVEHLRSLK